MKRFYVVLLALSTQYSLIAQEFRSGFIVNLKRDTVRGSLIYGTDFELSSSVTFKESESANKTVYRPADLLSYGFDNGRTFVRFSGTATLAGGDSAFVFAKKILGGRIDLYTYRKGTGIQPDIFLVNNYSGRNVHLTKPEEITTTDERGLARTGESFKHLGLIRIVKGDSAFNSVNQKKFKYTEKAIRNDILSYNEGFKDFPTSQYQRQVDYSYCLVAGIPFNSPNATDVAFRVAIYRNMYFPESSRRFSLLRGISYRYSYINSTVPSGVKNSNETFRQQWISLIPVGIHLQADSRAIKPYVYIGPGLAILWGTGHEVYNYEYKGNSNWFLPMLTLNMGAGVKIKTGTKFLIAELSPTGNRSGTCINIGYAF